MELDQSAENEPQNGAESPERYIWVVIYDNYGDTWTSAIFDSEEKAKAYEEARDPVAKRRYEYIHDYRIEKWVVE